MAITLDASELHGKVVVLDFWAAWCKPCLEEWAPLNAFAAGYRNRRDVAIFAIASQENESLDDVRRFLATHHNDLVAAFDANATLATAFHAYGLPTLVVIDGSGLVRCVHSAMTPRVDSWTISPLASELCGRSRPCSGRIHKLCVEKRTRPPVWLPCLEDPAGDPSGDFPIGHR